MDKFKALFLINPFGFIIFIGVNIVFFLLRQFVSINIPFISILFHSCFIIMGIMLNRIIFQRNYLKIYFQNDTNNIFTIFINAIKCNIKYFLYFFLLFFAMLLILFIIIFIKENGIHDYIQYIMNIENTNIPIIIFVFCLFLYMIVYYKLIFIEHVLVQKQDNYEIKILVKKSFEIIIQNKCYVLGLYLIGNIIIILASVINTFFLHDLYVKLIIGIIQTLIICFLDMLFLLYYREKINHKNE